MSPSIYGDPGRNTSVLRATGRWTLTPWAIFTPSQRPGLLVYTDHFIPFLSSSTDKRDRELKWQWVFVPWQWFYSLTPAPINRHLGYLCSGFTSQSREAFLCSCLTWGYSGNSHVTCPFLPGHNQGTEATWRDLWDGAGWPCALCLHPICKVKNVPWTWDLHRLSLFWML
jgi:hypothetical protein